MAYHMEYKGIQKDSLSIRKLLYTTRTVHTYACWAYTNEGFSLAVIRAGLDKSQRKVELKLMKHSVWLLSTPALLNLISYIRYSIFHIVYQFLLHFISDLSATKFRFSQENVWQLSKSLASANARINGKMKASSTHTYIHTYVYRTN